MNIILVHGAWADGSVWSKVIPLLQGAAHRVIAVHLPFHSLADDVGTVKRAIELVGSPTIVAGHSYGGMVITNAAYNNPNVKGLVYVAAFAPKEGQSAPLPEPPVPPEAPLLPLEPTAEWAFCSVTLAPVVNIPKIRTRVTPVVIAINLQSITKATTIIPNRRY